MVRQLATSFPSLALVAAFQLVAWTGPTASAQTVLTSVPAASAASLPAASAASYVCPQCGKVHTRSTVSAGANFGGTAAGVGGSGGNVQLASAQFAAPRNAVSTSGGGIQNVLSMLNQQRARQGVGTLRYDPQLQAVAQRRAQAMASRGLKSHPPGSFAPGRYEGVGWSSSFSPSGVSACYTSDSRMQYAGAAMATGRDGVYFAVVYR